MAGGAKGSYAQDKTLSNSGIQKMKSQVEAQADPRLQQMLQGISSGKVKWQDAISGMSKNRNSELDSLQKAMEAKWAESDKIAKQHFREFAGGRAEQEARRVDMLKQGEAISDQMNNLKKDAGYDKQMQDQLFVDPQTGSLIAADQVQNNPLLSGMFGKGGMQDRMLAEEKDLSSRGWSLQPEDHEAYGQASDETARMFGQEEGSLARALASRGLASGPNGAAAVGFSGLAGNKSERLASAQRKIANDRMKMNQERLQSVRNAALQGNQQGMSALNQQFDRNMQGVNSSKDDWKNSAAAAAQEQDFENTRFGQIESTRGPNLMEAGSAALGTAAKAALGAATGGASLAAEGAADSLGSAAKAVKNKPRVDPYI